MLAIIACLTDAGWHQVLADWDKYTAIAAAAFQPKTVHTSGCQVNLTLPSQTVGFWQVHYYS